jgi:hypothetical protein
MRSDIDDNIAGREASRQPILVEYDHTVENRLIQRTVAKPPSLGHEASPAALQGGQRRALRAVPTIAKFDIRFC